MMTFAEAQLHRQPCGLSFESFNFLKDRGDVTQAVADGVRIEVPRHKLLDFACRPSLSDPS
jgi:hypothetical protein